MGSARPKTSALMAVLAAAAITLASCDGPAADPTSPSPGTTTEAPAGAYTFSLGGLEASLELRGSTAELEVHNGTGEGVGPPGVVWLGAVDGRERPAVVREAEPIPRGERVRLEVLFPPEFHPRRAGLIILTLDSIPWGAFNPP